MSVCAGASAPVREVSGAALRCGAKPTEVGDAAEGADPTQLVERSRESGAAGLPLCGEGGGDTQNGRGFVKDSSIPATSTVRVFSEEGSNFGQDTPPVNSRETELVVAAR